MRKLLCEYLAVLKGHVFALILESRACHEKVWSQITGMFFLFKKNFPRSHENSFAWTFIHLEMYVYEDFCKEFVELNRPLKGIKWEFHRYFLFKSLAFLSLRSLKN